MAESPVPLGSDLINLGRELVAVMEDYMEQTEPKPHKARVYMKRTKWAWQTTDGQQADGFDSARKALSDWFKQGRDIPVFIEDDRL